MTLRISVVIPTYKSAPWIEQTIGSVLQQTYPLENIELIVVDDASPDDTVAVTRGLLDAAPIKSQLIVREKNTGVTANRNAGWRAAAGDWIQFLDHDDALMAHKLQLQADRAARAGRCRPDLLQLEIAVPDGRAVSPRATAGERTADRHPLTGARERSDGSALMQQCKVLQQPARAAPQAQAGALQQLGNPATSRAAP
jgi:glycosyltransferase involved in cell wall biosynthesis